MVIAIEANRHPPQRLLLLASLRDPLKFRGLMV